MLFAALAVAVGMTILLIAAGLLVRSAVGIATALGVPPLIIGLSVVAMGTVAPEMVLNIGAALSGEGVDVATGTIVGSSIANILLVLGTAALFRAIAVHNQLVRLEVPLLILTAAGVWWMAADGMIDPLEGTLLLLVLTGYLLVGYRLEKTRSTEAGNPDVAFLEARSVARAHLPRNIVLLLAAFIGLVVGADLTVDGATDLATTLGVGELLIGLTIVAVGTSLPELVTAITAVRKEQADLAVGTILGSSLLNLLGVFGITAIIGGGIEIPEAMVRVDLPVVLLITLIALPVLASGLVIERWEGLLMLGVYGSYIGYLVIDSAGSPMASTVRTAMFGSMIFVAVLMVVVAVRHHDQDLA